MRRNYKLYIRQKLVVHILDGWYSLSLALYVLYIVGYCLFAQLLRINHTELNMKKQKIRKYVNISNKKPEKT